MSERLSPNGGSGGPSPKAVAPMCINYPSTTTPAECGAGGGFIQGSKCGTWSPSDWSVAQLRFALIAEATAEDNKAELLPKKQKVWTYGPHGPPLRFVLLKASSPTPPAPSPLPLPPLLASRKHRA